MVSADVRIPERDTSIPFVLYGNVTSLRERREGFGRAEISTFWPGEGSLLRPIIRANLSKQFPTAMSSVSPKILYLCCEYAKTCVFPPET